MSLLRSTVAVADCGSASPPRAEQLQRVRRLDWRFLLPDPRLRDVALIGHDDGGLVDALRAHSESLVVLDEAILHGGPAAGSGESGVARRFDGIVIHGGALERAARAHGLLRPGGWLYWELDRRRAPLATPAVVSRRLRGAGFDSVALHWHRPSFSDAVDVVPLAAPRLLGALLQRESSRPARRMLARAARALHAARVLERAVPCSSVVARAAGGAAAPANAVAAFLGAQRTCPGSSTRPSLAEPDSLAYSFRLPRFTASSHVLAFAHARGSTSPVLVAKVNRLAGDESALEREAAALAAVQEIRPGGFDSIPRLVAFESWAGSRWLVQTGLAGRTMTAAWVRRHEPNCVAAVFAWLLELHRASRGAPLGPRGVARLLGELFAAPQNDEIAPLAARTLELAPSLASLPAVFEHGDLAAPNLLIAPPGTSNRIGVVDWELADPCGLAGADLVFFLAFVAGARAGARTPAEHAAAYRGTILASASGCAPLEAYAQALDLPRSTLPAILAATWARATLRARARAGGATAAAARPLALWRETLRHLGGVEQ